LSELLGDESFPSIAFSSGDVLAGLRVLGMKKALTCRGVVDSARSVAGEGGAKGMKRSKCLLRFVDDNIEGLLQQCRDEEAVGHPAYSSYSQQAAVLGDVVDLTAEVSEVSEVPKEVPFPVLDVATIEGRFVEQLAGIPWLPCVSGGGDDLLPPHRSGTGQGGFASAAETRPREEAVLCSANKRLLDGFVSSDVVKRCFGWDKDVDILSVAHQLLALSDVFFDRGQSLPAFRQTLASTIPRMYTLLDKWLDGGEGRDLMNEVQALLMKKKWLWVGDAFVGVDRVAFEATENARPHLFAVPKELECFAPLLRYFGVRDKFFASDYVRVNAELFRLSGEGVNGGGVLQKAELELAAGMAKLLAGMDKEEREGAGQLYLPSERGVLMKAEDMVYDDAPWLSSSIGQTKVKARFVHELVGVKAAEVLGAKSLREVLLANQSGMQNIPCPSAASLKQLLGKRAKARGTRSEERAAREDTKVVMDLLEVAEMAGVSKIKILADFRTHKDESLLHPGLAKGQGPALMVCMSDFVMSVDDLVRLSAPSGYYRTSSSRMDGNGGMPRLGSGLCSLYQLGDCLQVLSGNQLHLFDPTGTYLFGGEGEKKKKKGKEGQPIARRYGLDTDDMHQNFGDQFTPFLEAGFGVKQQEFFQGTVFRVCLRREASGLSKRVFGERELQALLDELAPRLPHCFLFTRALTRVCLEKAAGGGEGGEGGGVQEVVSCKLRTSAAVRRDHLVKFSDNVEWKKSKVGWGWGAASEARAKTRFLGDARPSTSTRAKTAFWAPRG
jgi:sacsin